MITLIPPNRLTRPDTLDDDADKFFGDLPQFGADLMAVQANINSIAAGGAYAIPYAWGPGLGINTSGASLASTTLLVVPNVMAGGASALALLQQFDASNSATKGYMRIVKMGDPSKWLVFKVTSRADSGAGYQVMYGSLVAASDAAPFSEADPVMLFFERTGDRGDTGPAGSLTVPRLHVREQYSSGSLGPTLSSSTWTTRAMNTAVWNTISNAAVASNQIVLDPGTYDFRGWAIAVGTDGRHRAGLKNITSGAFIIYGSSEYLGPNAYTTGSKSLLEGRVVLSARTTIELQHYVSGAFTAGSPVNSGTSECYSELIFEKVA